MSLPPRLAMVAMLAAASAGCHLVPIGADFGDDVDPHNPDGSLTPAERQAAEDRQFRQTYGGPRTGRTYALERVDRVEPALGAPYGRQRVRDRMGFLHDVPIPKPRRELVFIDTPKPVGKRAARRKRARKDA